jgi:hypothetical protein
MSTEDYINSLDKDTYIQDNVREKMLFIYKRHYGYDTGVKNFETDILKVKEKIDVKEVDRIKKDVSTTASDLDKIGKDRKIQDIELNKQREKFKLLAEARETSRIESMKDKTKKTIETLESSIEATTARELEKKEELKKKEELLHDLKFDKTVKQWEDEEKISEVKKKTAEMYLDSNIIDKDLYKIEELDGKLYFSKTSTDGISEKFDAEVLKPISTSSDRRQPLRDGITKQLSFGKDNEEIIQIFMKPYYVFQITPTKDNYYFVKSEVELLRKEIEKNKVVVVIIDDLRINVLNDLNHYNIDYVLDKYKKFEMEGDKEKLNDDGDPIVDKENEKQIIEYYKEYLIDGKTKLYDLVKPYLLDKDVSFDFDVAGTISPDLYLLGRDTTLSAPIIFSTKDPFKKIYFEVNVPNYDSMIQILSSWNELVEKYGLQFEDSDPIRPFIVKSVPDAPVVPPPPPTVIDAPVVPPAVIAPPAKNLLEEIKKPQKPKEMSMLDQIKKKPDLKKTADVPMESKEIKVIKIPTNLNLLEGFLKYLEAMDIKQYAKNYINLKKELEDDKIKDEIKQYINEKLPTITRTKMVKMQNIQQVDAQKMIEKISKDVNLKTENERHLELIKQKKQYMSEKSEIYEQINNNKPPLEFYKKFGAAENSFIHMFEDDYEEGNWDDDTDGTKKRKKTKPTTSPRKNKRKKTPATKLRRSPRLRKQ